MILSAVASTLPAASRSQVRASKVNLKRGSAFCLFSFLLLTMWFTPKGGEGSVMGMHGGRAGHEEPAKTHVAQPRQIYESNQTLKSKNSKTNSVQKRSYRRALHRIAQHGYTWYRGRLLSGPCNPVRSMDTPFKHDQQNIPPSTSMRKSRLSIFSWNCGGLTQAAWDHFQQWLMMQSLDVIMLQETHWQFSSEWQQGQYYCMHTGVGPRQAGLLTMVSKRLVHQNCISWSEPVKGRLLHIRIHGMRKGCDLINVYQHVHSATRMDDRAQVWHELHDLLSTLPKRNTLYMAGDFNTSLHKRCNAVGLSTYVQDGRRHWGPAHRDEDQLCNLMSVCHIVALNTWRSSLGPTYTFGTQSSRIDYICTKNTLADQMSRDAQYLHAFPLLPLTGSQHVPIVCSVLKAWTPMQHVQQPGWSRAQRKALYIQWTRHDEHARALQRHVESQIALLPDNDADKLNTLHRCLNEIENKTYSQSPSTHPFQHDATPFQEFQTHTTWLRECQFTTDVQLKTLFEVWTHVAKRQKARRCMNLTAKAARKQRIDQIFAQANTAERAQDSFQFYQAIRELAPKQPFKRIQLRSKTGVLLGPPEAADLLRDWFQDLYSAQDSHQVHEHFQWPFTSDEMCIGFQRLPSFKALDPAYAPSPIWQAAASSASSYLQPYLEFCSLYDRLPGCWSNGTLTFLCKPGKSGRSPAELRPIALLEPSGKTVMGLIACRLLQSLSSRLFRLPQFAYLPCRGGDQAIMRVRQHCCDVRSLLFSLRHNIHRAANSVPGPDVAGGFLLSLDLTLAFDSVLRSQLFRALQELGADPISIAMLSQIYAETNFSFWHRGQHRTLPTQRGIRQGCKAAPILWASFAAWILEMAAHAHGWDWIRQVITAYADDFCLHCLLNSSMEVHDAIAKVGAFLDLLTTVGLTINRDKTIALLKLHGPGKAKIYKRFIKRTRDGHFICIPSKHGQPYCIRLVSQISYLGVILSYTNFELLTMRHRIKAGIKVSQQLQRWIFVKTGLTRKQKIKLWFQCIFPCLVYGLRSIGLTSQTAIMLDRTFMQQLRRLCHSPVHLTHLNHVDFLAWAGATDPLLRLLHQCQKAQHREWQRHHSLQEDDIIHTCWPCDISIEQVLLEIFEQRHLSATLGEAEYTPHACHLCTKSFTTMLQLRRHLALAHGSRTGLLRNYHATDSLDGVPTCKRCGLIFTTWNRLQYHVKYVCVADTQEDEDAEHRLRVREYLHYVQGMSFVALGQRQDLTAYFSHRCILCGKFLLTQRGVLQHWGDDHNDTFRQHGVWNSFLQQNIGHSNPCEFCGTHFRREHCCVVIRQYAMYMTFHGQAPPLAGPASDTAFPCQKCNKVFLTKHGLEQHLRNFHSALQVGNQLTDIQLDAYCLVMQAVETEACRDLLGHEHIVELLSHVCLLCQKIFQRKNELVRHFKSHHSSFWHQSVIDAAQLETELKQPTDCYCMPKVYNRKHLCMLTLQYALLRLTAVPGPDAELTRSSPPDLLLTPAEVVRQLAWLGLLRLLTHNPALKLSLSLHCQVCASHFTSPTLLMGHMRALHGQSILEAEAWIRMLAWVLFSAHGCMCNPAVNHGTPAHACPLIYNLALMINDDAPGIVVPWHYRATDLMDVLAPMVSEPVLSKVTTLMMTRRFEDVLLSTEIYQLLTQRCMLCDIVLPLHCARTHIRVAHNFDLKCLEVITDQLAACAAQTHFDHWCNFCGQLLPYDLNDDNLTPCPEQHLKECDYIALVAMLLSYPVWYKKPYVPDAWPTVDEVERGSHETHLQLMQFNALPSDQADALGTSYEQLAACGFFMMSDPKFHERLQYQCLMCDRRFFTPWRMFEHLQSHNYRQLDTFMCSHRLHLRCQQPCQLQSATTLGAFEPTLSASLSPGGIPLQWTTLWIKQTPSGAASWVPTKWRP